MPARPDPDRLLCTENVGAGFIPARERPPLRKGGGKPLPYTVGSDREAASNFPVRPPDPGARNVYRLPYGAGMLAWASHCQPLLVWMNTLMRGEVLPSTRRAPFISSTLAR